MTYPDARAAVAALANGTAGLTELREIVVSFPELRPVVAAYPAADEALIGWLADLHDPAIDAQLARRSGTTAMPSPPPPGGQETTLPTDQVGEQWDAVQWERFAETPAPAATAFPAASTGAQTPPAGEPGVPRRRVWPVVVAVVAALALVGGGVGAAWGFGLFRTPANTTQATRPVSTNPPPPTSAAPAPSTPTGLPSSTSQSASPAAAGFTCWDGTTASVLSDCGGPEGIAGMRYMFPSLADHLASAGSYSCRQVEYPKRDKYTVSYDCPLAGETAQSSTQLVRYRYWTDAKASLKHYRGVFSEGGSQPFRLNGKEVGTVFSSNGPMAEGNGRYAMAFVLLGGHMCLSVEGASQPLLDDMLKEARFRVPDQFKGHPGADASETTWQR